MARIFSAGFETNPGTTVNIELTTMSGSTVTSPVHGGTYAQRLNPSGTQQRVGNSIKSSAPAESMFYRFALQVATNPLANVGIFTISDGGKFKALKVGVRLTTTGTLQAYNFEDSAQIGSDSPALVLSQWYVVELNIDTTTISSTSVTARIDGVQFATGTVNLASSQNNFTIGNIANATFDIYIDDIAINDTTGSNETSWPSTQGKIIHLMPNATGDANAWTRGGTDSGANWSQCDELPPNGVTDYNTSTTLGQEDLFNCGACTLSSKDQIKFVNVVGWFASDNAANNPTIKMECEKTSAGTISQGTGIAANSTGYRSTNLFTTGSPSLILYNDPDSNPWSPTTLNSMQIGYKITTDNTNNIRMSTVWALVEYVAAIIPKSLNVNQSIHRSNSY